MPAVAVIATALGLGIAQARPRGKTIVPRSAGNGRAATGFPDFSKNN